MNRDFDGELLSPMIAGPSFAVDYIYTRMATLTLTNCASS